MTSHLDPAVGTAVVLGPGGLVGTAWMAGLAAELGRRDVDLALADLIVGTSAGAIVGAMLATGEDLTRFAAPRPGASVPTSAAVPRPAPAVRQEEVFAVLGDPALTPAEALRRVGRLAFEAATITEEEHLTRMGRLVTARAWPERPLLITTVNIETGEPQVWDRTSEVPLIAAIAASSAAPGTTPPVAVNGHHYLDGAFGGGSHASLAAGAGVLVLVEPLAHLFPAADPPGDAVVRIAPDAETIQVFGSDLGEVTSWLPAYEAGVRQGAEAAGRIREVWPAARV
ncbi:patatin-like phospholipase family protein [Nonomuraea sp. 3-1Str]|uniref:patatin-like phospholipase family protein n=1 Tax=Nonomuraea sp. 3-1Str TaxID=2929801 RepID=UPI00285B37AD|nr:patatin-like phospholipase family protein [Nonomuraea sp. 3-1Str]MDR8410831.1 patatin-like phospholipase family protein [Nonomuraea sp. 3-1Str]